ncbi:aromatic ring-hydroxylating dioxygenase subunit alpha [bacterium]|nr:aromatic ring-hydroxylating dioxygenase subunit alpha [bacterium]
MRERCGTLKDRWYVAALSSEVSASRPIGRRILEENLVLHRGARGEPLCFRDRCLHRNAQLSEGRIEGGCLVCPYHGWSYDRDGHCVRIPSEGPESFVRPLKTLERFETREQDGLVWVFLGDAAKSRGDPFRFPHVGEPGWESYTMVTRFENDVTNCVENFIDVPHTLSVHGTWFRDEVKRKIAATVERTADSVSVTYHHEGDRIGFWGRILNPWNEPVTHTDRFFMPNVTRVDYDFGEKRSFVITSQCTPVAPLETLVFTGIAYRLGSRVLDRLARIWLPRYTRKVIEQDVVILANQGRSLRAYGRDFLNAEADLHHLHVESLRDWAERGETGPPPAPEKREVTFYV